MDYLWATTSGNSNAEYDRRIYSICTRDWSTFTPARPFFDPGFLAIDSTILKVGRRWQMVFKDEQNMPLVKKLRLAWAPFPKSPWSDVTKPFTEAWVKGPTVLKIGQWGWLYLDHYTKPQHYSTMRTRDWVRFGYHGDSPSCRRPAPWNGD